MSEKKTEFYFIIELLAESPITPAAALFALRKSIDNDILEDKDLMILTLALTDPETFPRIDSDSSRKASKAKNKIREIASRSPGALGDLYSFMKGYKWHQIYIGFAAVVLIGTLLFKWAVRLITGGF